MVAPATITVYDNLYAASGAAVSGATVNCVLNGTQETTAGGLISPTQQSTTTDGSGRFAFTVVCNDLLSPANSTYTIMTPFRTYDIAPQSANGASQQTTAANVIVNTPLALAPWSTITGPLTISGTLTVVGAMTAASLNVTAGEPGIDTTAAGALLIGDNNATSIEIGAPTSINAGGATGATLNAAGDLALRSITVGSSSPYAPTSVTGGADFAAAVRFAGGKPWWDVTHPTYGAKGDWQTVSDGVMNGTTAVLTSVSGKFVAADVGKKIWVAGAGAAGVGLNTTVASYQSATQVTLTANSATVVAAAVVQWTTDDTVAIQAALTACRVAGGGIVYLPPGIYGTSMGTVHPLAAGYYPSLIVGANTTLLGSGRNGSILKLIAGQTIGNDLANANLLMTNYNIAAGGDEQITLQDFTFDGNSGHQTHVHQGLTLMKTRGARLLRVRALNVRGSITLETFFIESQLGTDTAYTDCEVVGTAGTTSTGFSDDNASNIKYENCVAYGMSVAGPGGHGFTHNLCSNLQYINCHSYLNAGYGFNSEISDDVIYVNCIAGGVSTNTATYPYTAATALGNTGGGFVINATTRAELIGCVGRKNTGSGLFIQGVTSGIVVGGEYSDNTVYGISLDANSMTGGWRVTGAPIVTGNTTAGFGLPAGQQNFGPLVNPAVPATTVALASPVPYDCIVYITAGASTVTVKFGAFPTFVIPINGIASVKVPGGALANKLSLTYANAPTWNWFSD